MSLSNESPTTVISFPLYSLNLFALDINLKLDKLLEVEFPEEIDSP
jgi:hypothetical protein